MGLDEDTNIEQVKTSNREQTNETSIHFHPLSTWCYAWYYARWHVSWPCVGLSSELPLSHALSLSLSLSLSTQLLLLLSQYSAALSAGGYVVCRVSPCVSVSRVSCITPRG